METQRRIISEKRIFWCIYTYLFIGLHHVIFYIMLFIKMIAVLKVYKDGNFNGIYYCKIMFEKPNLVFLIIEKWT